MRKKKTANMKEKSTPSRHLNDNSLQTCCFFLILVSLLLPCGLGYKDINWNGLLRLPCLILLPTFFFFSCVQISKLVLVSCHSFSFFLSSCYYINLMPSVHRFFFAFFRPSCESDIVIKQKQYVDASCLCCHDRCFCRQANGR